MWCCADERRGRTRGEFAGRPAGRDERRDGPGADGSRDRGLELVGVDSGAEHGEDVVRGRVVGGPQPVGVGAERLVAKAGGAGVHPPCGGVLCG